MSAGGGKIPPSGPPGTSLPSVTFPQHPPSQGEGGIIPHTKPNVLPGGHNKTPDTPIGERSTVSTRLPPQFNQLKALEDHYHEQFNQVLSFQAQFDFLNFIPSLEQRLQDPSLFQDDLPFEIIYVEKGKMTSILPPDPEVPPDSEEATKLRQSLQEKLSVIHQKNGPEERRTLLKQIENANADLAYMGQSIEDLGGMVPQPPIPKITLVIDENQFTAQAPARRYYPEETPGKEKGAGQFLLIPKDASKRMPPPVAKKPVKPVTVPSEGFQPTAIQPLPHPPVTGTNNYIERLLPVNTAGADPDIFLTEETDADYGRAGNIASVNAGSVDLVFGSKEAGINAQFGEFFSDAEQDQIEQLQKDFLASAKQAELTEYIYAHEEAVEESPLAAMYGCFSGASDYQGSVVISVFKDAYCPEGIQKNRAMIYVVPPDGTSNTYDDKEDFLKDIKLTAKNLIATQNKYNHWAAKKGHPILPVLRTCVFGGDSNCHPDSNRREVAQAIRSGIKEYFAEVDLNQNTIREVQYETAMGEEK